MASMIEYGDDDPTEAREAVFSAIMIVCNGLVGLCLLLGGFRHHEQELQPMATSAYLAILIALSVLTLILPDYTTSSYGPTLSSSQLVFVSVLSVLLYSAFLFIQTVRHRSYFIDVHVAAVGHGEAKPSRAMTIFAVVGLGASLLGVSLLAERVIPGLEEALRWLGVDDVNRVTGAAVAMLVLLPESMNSIRAATRNALQTSINGALGSVVATIGLTVPAVALLERRDEPGDRVRSRETRHCLAAADIAAQRGELRRGPNQSPDRARASCRFRDIYFSVVRALSSRIERQ